jgi:hypothetical protein
MDFYASVLYGTMRPTLLQMPQKEEIEGSIFSNPQDALHASHAALLYFVQKSFLQALMSSVTAGLPYGDN